MKKKTILLVQISIILVLISCRKNESLESKNPPEIAVAKNPPIIEATNANIIKMHNFTGNYFGSINGVEITMQLISDETSLTGNLVMNGEKAQISATASDVVFKGKITEDVSQKSYAIIGEWKKEKLYLSMTFPEYNNKTIEVILEKAEANTTSSSSQQRN